MALHVPQFGNTCPRRIATAMSLSCYNQNKNKTTLIPFAKYTHCVTFSRVQHTDTEHCR